MPDSELLSQRQPWPEPTPAEDRDWRIRFYAARIQYPWKGLTEAVAQSHRRRTFALAAQKATPQQPLTWSRFQADCFMQDWLLAVGCLERIPQAWEQLFESRTGRSEGLLVDALRSRAFRLYPRDELQREQAVSDFWSWLILPVGPEQSPILARYDGLRPLSPWLIRVFQNWQLTLLRGPNHTVSLAEDDLLGPQVVADAPDHHASRWHQEFLEAGRLWLSELDDQERLLLGLRWRYQLSQRDVAGLLKVHEGTITRRIDKLRDHALSVIGQHLAAAGWTGDNLTELILNEMQNLLLESPSLRAESLRALLHRQGVAEPQPPQASPPKAM